MTDDTDQVASTGGFWDHVEALRGVLLRCAVTVVVMAAVLFAVMPWIFDNIILAPAATTSRSTAGSVPCRPDGAEMI